MIKRIVVAGSRDYDNYEEAKEYIDFCISNIKCNNTLIFMSGGCRGADKLGERYALEKEYKIEKYPADWNVFGKRAGPKRNKIMAEKCDYVICFWDGKSKGTESIIRYARYFGKPLRIKNVGNDQCVVPNRNKKRPR